MSDPRDIRDVAGAALVRALLDQMSIKKADGTPCFCVEPAGECKHEQWCRSGNIALTLARTVGWLEESELTERPSMDTS